MSLQDEWQKYLLNEKIEQDVFMYIQGLQEILRHIKPKTAAENRRLALATKHISEVRKYARRMQNQIDLLQEKVSILEENLNESKEK